jgi:AcrR family transcriptional regulator
MSSDYQAGSPRRAELLDACYGYLLEHGLTGLSLRPLAAATGTSPRVLLYLFGSKEDLVRDLLARARREQIALVASALDPGTARGGFEALADRLWNLLSAPEQRAMVRLTYEAFLRSVSRDPGPWQGFAAETARDWLGLLIRAQPDAPRDVAEATATRTLALIRGLLLDLLAGEDPGRVTSAVQAGPWQPALGSRYRRDAQAETGCRPWTAGSVTVLPWCCSPGFPRPGSPGAEYSGARQAGRWGRPA